MPRKYCFPETPAEYIYSEICLMLQLIHQDGTLLSLEGREKHFTIFVGNAFASNWQTSSLRLLITIKETKSYLAMFWFLEELEANYVVIAYLTRMMNAKKDCSYMAMIL